MLSLVPFYMQWSPVLIMDYNGFPDALYYNTLIIHSNNAIYGCNKIILIKIVEWHMLWDINLRSV